MKKLLLILITATSFVACKKDDNNSTTTGGAGGDCSKFPYRKGSSVTANTAGGGNTLINTYTLDTTIAGQYYVGSKQTSGGITATAYLGLNTSKEVLLFLPAVGDLPDLNQTYFKLTAGVNSTWSYTYTSKFAPTIISYKYAYTILSNSETFSFAGTNYTGGQKIKLVTQVITSGVVSQTITTYATYCCGIGIVMTDDATNVRTLTAYTY